MWDKAQEIGTSSLPIYDTAFNGIIHTQERRKVINRTTDDKCLGGYCTTIMSYLFFGFGVSLGLLDLAEGSGECEWLS